MERTEYRLTAKEVDQLNQLPKFQGEAIKFWTGAAIARGLDYKTIIGNTQDHASFTALPVGHGKHWCYPALLKVR
jgi:hypothetical protein